MWRGSTWCIKKQVKGFFVCSKYNQCAMWQNRKREGWVSWGSSSFISQCSHHMSPQQWHSLCVTTQPIFALSKTNNVNSYMSRMRFFHLHSAENATSLRRGSVHFAQKNKTIQTPACLTYTLRGSVPHLVADNLKLLPVESVQVSLDHL